MLIIFQQHSQHSFHQGLAVIQILSARRCLLRDEMDSKAPLTTVCKTSYVYVSFIRYYILEAEQPGQLPPGEEGILGFSTVQHDFSTLTSSQLQQSAADIASGKVCTDQKIQQLMTDVRLISSYTPESFGRKLAIRHLLWV